MANLSSFLKLFLRGLAALFALLCVLLLCGVRRDITLEALQPKWANTFSRFMDVNGAHVHYRDEGKGEVIMLLHGTGASLQTWDGWTAELTKKYRVLRLDLPGFGLTGPDGSHDYSMPHYVKFLDAFLTRLDISRVHIVGNSYGGHMAWEFAVAHPERTASLMLVDSAGYPRKKFPWTLQLARTPGLSAIFRWVTPRFLVRKTLLDVYGDDSKVTDALVDRYDALQLRAGNREAFVERVKTNFPDDTAKLAALKMPSLVMWGDADPWIPIEYAHRFHDAIAGSELVVYQRVGHVPMEEVPDVSVHDALRFLDAHHANTP